MPGKDVSTEDRVKRGKRLVLYGMFSLILVTFVSSFLTLMVLVKKADPAFWGGKHPIADLALVPSLIITVVALVVCVIGWFVYTRVILKD